MNENETEYIIEKEITPKFPLFVSLKGKRVLVVGGGAVALRRASALVPFGCEITVIAPSLDPQLSNTKAKLLCRPYQAGDCSGFDLVLAATDCRLVNHQVYLEAKQLHLMVNVSDCPQECDFYFPGIVQRDEVVVGVTASGTNHRLAGRITRHLKEKLDEICREQGE